MVKISIIMPTFNSEKYIVRSVNSILSQAYSDFELIIINDGSQDNTENEVYKLMEQDRRIKYFKIKNSGTANARNVGIDNAAGEYLAFIDSDDYIDKFMMEKLINKATEYNCDIVSCSYEWISPSKSVSEKTYLSKGYYNKEDLEEKVYINILSSKSLNDIAPKTMVTKLIKRELIERYDIRLIPSLRIGEDTLFVVKCMLYADSFYYLPDKKYYKYVLNPLSVTNTYNEGLWTDLKENAQYMKKISKKFSDYGLEGQLPYVLIRNSMTAIANLGRNTNTNRQKTIKELNVILNDMELRDSLKNIDYSEFGLTRKTLVFLMKKKQLKLLYLLTELYSKLLN